MKESNIRRPSRPGALQTSNTIMAAGLSHSNRQYDENQSGAIHVKKEHDGDCGEAPTQFLETDFEQRFQIKEEMSFTSEPPSADPMRSSSSTPLPRGTACINCRRKKLKCDGVKPICGNCQKTKRPSDCEYTIRQGRTRVEMLEEQVSQLQAKIRDLENPEEVPRPVFLIDPHSQSGGDGAGSSTNTSISLLSQHTQYTQAIPLDGNQDPNNIWWTSEFPPLPIAQQLLGIFLRHADQLGFVLNSHRFRNAFFLPPNHPNRPNVALLNTVFLWAVRLRRLPNFNAIEPFYLNRALTSLPDALQAGVNSQLQTIQAESLLSLHFYYQGRFLEGRYHADAAVSIAMSLRLHKVGSTTVPAPPAIGFNIPTGNGDYIAKGEKIDLFWMVFNLDKCWSVAFGLPSVLPDDRSDANSIDTPWPLSPESYEQGALPSSSRDTVLAFLLQNVGSGDVQSVLSLRSRASALFEYATRFSGRYVTVASHGGSFLPELVSIQNTISLFSNQIISALSSTSERQSTVADERRRSYFVTLSVAQAAIIQLHRLLIGTEIGTNLNSRNACLSASLAIIGVLDRISADDLHFLDPIMSVALVASCNVFVEEVNRGTSGGDTSQQTLELRRQRTVAQLTRTITMMEAWAEYCPLLGTQAELVKQLRASL